MSIGSGTSGNMEELVVSIEVKWNTIENSKLWKVDQVYLMSLIGKIGGKSEFCVMTLRGNYRIF